MYGYGLTHFSLWQTRLQCAPSIAPTTLDQNLALYGSINHGLLTDEDAGVLVVPQLAAQPHMRSHPRTLLSTLLGRFWTRRIAFWLQRCALSGTNTISSAIKPSRHHCALCDISGHRQAIQLSFLRSAQYSMLVRSCGSIFTMVTSFVGWEANTLTDLRTGHPCSKRW